MCLFHPPPNFKGFAKLTNLNLHRTIFDPAIFSNLISKCPLLESLRLFWCTNCDILEIDAANLKLFDFLGTSKSICFKNAPMLKIVTVWLSSQDLIGPSLIYPNLTKFFHYMPSLEELELSGSTLKEIVGIVMQSQPVMQFLRVKSIPSGVLKVLQRVEMCYFTGREMEMEFVKFILASALILEDIFIWDAGEFNRGTQMMDEMNRESANARFKFEEN